LLRGAKGNHLELDRPRPFRSGSSLALVAVLPLVGGLTGVIRPLSSLVLAGIFIVAGALRGSFAHFELTRLRRMADRELRLETSPYVRSTLAAWRAAELSSSRHRIALARMARRTERDLSPGKLPGASPLNRVAARPHADLLRQLAERLSALDRPVSPQAILGVEDLLTSPESPLYERERAYELRASLLASLRALAGSADELSAESAPASRQWPVPVGRNGERRLATRPARPRAVSLAAAHSRLRRFAVARRKARH